MSIAELIKSPPKGVFSIIGEIKWLDYPRQVTSYGTVKKLREGKVIDNSSEQINFSMGIKFNFNSIFGRKHNIPNFKRCSYMEE